MNTRPIRVCKFNGTTQGYRLWLSENRLDQSQGKKRYDAWVPELAPSPALRQKWLKGKTSWRAFKQLYGEELDCPMQQEMLKPLALLARRLNLILLHDSSDSKHCPEKIVAEKLKEIQRREDYRLIQAPWNQPWLWRRTNSHDKPNWIF